MMGSKIDLLTELFGIYILYTCMYKYWLFFFFNIHNREFIYNECIGIYVYDEI